MQFSCDTNKLNEGLSIVSRALAVRSSKPIWKAFFWSPARRAFA